MFKAVMSIAFCAILTFGMTSLHATAPHLISHQGLLTDAGGNPVADGSYSVTFTIYDASAGGTNLWSSGAQSVATTNGLYSYMLGSNVPFPSGLFSSTVDRWLGIQVGGDPEITPRTQLISSPYALEAENANLAQTVAPGVVGVNEIDPNQVQARVSGAAPVGQYIRAINSDGTVTTATDQDSGGDITAVTAGTGLSGGGLSGAVTVFADLTQVQARVSSAAPVGQYIRVINSDGTIITGTDQDSGGDITAVTAGAGLAGGGSSGAVTLSLAVAAVTSDKIAAGTITEQNVSQEDWSAPTLLNGWSNYSSGFNPVGYFKDINGIVHLRGMVKSGAQLSDVLALPPGYRPEYQEIQVDNTATGFGRVDIYPDGRVQFQEAPGAAWRSLDGITFRAASK